MLSQESGAFDGRSECQEDSFISAPSISPSKAAHATTPQAHPQSSKAQSQDAHAAQRPVQVVCVVPDASTADAVQDQLMQYLPAEAVEAIR